MRFQDLLGAFPWDISRKVRRKLERFSRLSATTRQFILNLFAECRLSAEDWETLAKRILAHRRSVADLRTVITAFCREGRQLRGGVVRLPRACVLGRAVDLDRIAYRLFQKGAYPTVRQATIAISKYVGSPIDTIDPKMLSLSPDEHLGWATFDLHDASPFGSWAGNRKRALCSLGISDSEGPTVLLEYLLPRGTAPNIPTICDAYAADQWTRWFRPALSCEDHGWTMPRDDCSDDCPRPECVHRPVRFQHLAKPLRYLL